MWRAADTWRIPLLLEEPDWKALAAGQESETAQELLAHRFQALVAKQDAWLVLQAYLADYLNQPDPAPRINTKPGRTPCDSVWINCPGCCKS